MLVRIMSDSAPVKQAHRLSEDEILTLLWVDGSLYWLHADCLWCREIPPRPQHPVGCGTLTGRHRLKVIKETACGKPASAGGAHNMGQKSKKSCPCPGATPNPAPGSCTGAPQFNQLAICSHEY